MRVLFIILIMAVSLGADTDWNKDKDEPFFQQRDKQAHIVAFTAISYVVTDYALDNGFTKTEAWFIGLGSALVLGAVKELTDDNFDEKDMMANAIGGTIGSSIVIWRW